MTAWLPAARAADGVLLDAAPGPDDVRLLAPAREVARITSALREDGWTAVGERWARFAGAGVQTVRVTDLAHLVLPADEHACLLRLARPTDDGLLTPSPAHALLLAAGAMAEGRSAAAAWRPAARALLGGDPEHRLAAKRRAARWGVVSALAHLERVAAGGDLTPADRAAARRELRTRRGSAAPLVDRGFVVALSGLDGSGKSLQSARLRATLQALGLDVTTEWTRLATGGELDRLAGPVKVLLGRFGGSSRTADPPAADERSTATGADDDLTVADDLAAAEWRRRVPALGWSWSVVVAGVNAVRRRQAVLHHLDQGRAVVADRYVLDSLVQLHAEYTRRTRVHAVLLDRGPRPLLACYLDVSPEEALRRKPGQYDLDQLRAQSSLYREQLDVLGVVRLDGTLPPDALTEQLARLVWRALGG